jgi:hypothetical protein
MKYITDIRWMLLAMGLLLRLGGSVLAIDWPGLEEALGSPRDVWGEAAMAQPNGASYEFLAGLLPPPRYVNADFRHYPIILCPPGEILNQPPAQFVRDGDPESTPKARLISDGSGLNLPGGSASWNTVGTPVRFRVGPDAFLFGSLRSRVSEPILAEGWLPIVEIRYTHPSPRKAEGMVPLAPSSEVHPEEVYRLEAFASTAAEFTEDCLVFVRFDLAQGTQGFLTVDVEGSDSMSWKENRWLDADGRTVAIFDSRWQRDRGRIVAKLDANASATLAIPCRPMIEHSALQVSPEAYARERDACTATWKERLRPGMQVEVPEPLVNHAWRNALCQNFQLINHGQLRYSTGNQYDRIYSAEGSDAVTALLHWGFEDPMRRLMAPLFAFSRKGLELHQASFKINNVVEHYWQTRDTASVLAQRPSWEKEAERFLHERTGPHGLYPKEQYCGDIATPVQSLNVNAKAWRALRDLGAVLAEIGETELAQRYLAEAAVIRKLVLQRIEAVADTTTTPPFIPIALDGGETVHDPILHYRIGSYWNIIIGYTIGSGIFPPGSPQETWIPRYQEQHGGIAMGMVKSGGAKFNFWTNDQRINPLYGTRYTLDTLRRDDPERALVSFYGTLAQGLTRNTFIGGEGCTLEPVDAEGRFFYCPPNSAASAHVLAMLRHLLVQDWDANDDGKPETLRLAFATSKNWLTDGKRLQVDRAPTAFGPVSYVIESRLSHGQVVADIELPVRQSPEQTAFRVRLPDGWGIQQVTADGSPLPFDERGTIDLTGRSGRVSLQVLVVPR